MTGTTAVALAKSDAPALRFLLLCLAGWVTFRLLVNLGIALTPGAPSQNIPFMAQGGESPATVALTARPSSFGERTLPRFLSPRLHERRERAVPAAMNGRRKEVDKQDGLAAPLARVASLPSKAPPWPIPSSLEDQVQLIANPAAGVSPPAAPEALRAVGRPAAAPRGSRVGWALSSWLYLRDGATSSAPAMAPLPQLGASQAGARIAYGMGQTGRIAAYGRASIALERLQQREVALGVAAAPIAGLPVDIAVEQRFSVGREGRTALAAMLIAGLGGLKMPAQFQLEAYGQAGMVGTRRRDMFVSGAAVIDRHVGDDRRSPLRLGMVMAAAAQPGASRVDVGPRATLRLPTVGEGARIALDWRQRIAGDAAPDSGLALTLAADF